MPVLTRIRSLLFMPGTRADMIAKIARIVPDVAAVDLEDAVAAADKKSARETAVAAIDALEPDARTTVLVRVNPVGTPWFAADVAAAARCAAAGLVVPKLSRSQDLHELRQALAENTWTDALVVAGIETALGVADARPLLAGGLAGAYFGAEDYIADIGGRRTAEGDEVLYARSHVCLAAYLAGMPSIDQAVVGLGDDEHFLAERRRAGRSVTRARSASTHARSNWPTRCSPRPPKRWPTPRPCWPQARPGSAWWTARWWTACTSRWPSPCWRGWAAGRRRTGAACFPTRRASRRGGRDVQAGPDRQSR